ncbi:Nucleoside-diphosphate-sugar epimerase [Rhizobium sp. RU35A]|uniref:SDR family oxidoreductase n=1 Tax=Rhizobium sp. RU35A TaxID=1907414 RepID=UPI000954AF8E|nr:SDR family oxidoreductase [Rhizobium sp. RU35A]SIR11523.1 Nucleoside-diphosphate-sugar epimerase [Rhizobium sp. RU35A]
MRMMIFGAGYSGQAIAGEALAAGMHVSGTSRSMEKCAALSAVGIEPFLFDGATLSAPLRDAMAQTTHLVQSIAPGAAGDPLLQLTEGDLAHHFPRLQWTTYLSTVGVYGDHGGAWVTEETECRPVSQRSVERVAAEQGWLEAGARAGVPVAVLRLSGIYGPGRNGFVNLAQGTARRLVKPGQVFNRIRVEDIGRATLFLAERHLGGLFNVTDDEPAPPQDVVTEAARLMGVEPPPEQAFETAELSPMARSFYGENKRVSNAKICNLGFSFRFPDYRISLADLWTSGRWKP